MLILGVSDGPDASAAAVVDDRLVAVHRQSSSDGVPRSRAFPWGAVDATLKSIHAEPGDVDLVAVAGRFSPPLFLRRRPGLRKLVGSAFSPVLDAQLVWQAMMRQSGWGAFEGDRAAEWLDGEFKQRGFGHRRLVTVDMHRALAEAAYRLQPRDEVLIISVHPGGDGAAVAVHVGRGGLLDRMWAQQGFASLHLHLRRCAEAMGFRPILDDPRQRGAAARGEPDPRLLSLLAELLYVDGPRLSRTRLPRKARPSRDPVYEALAEAPQEVAAASVMKNLRDTIAGLVRHHVREHGIPHVALAGEVFEDPRVVARIAEMDEVASVSVLPEAGWGSASVGAAVGYGGLAPHSPDLYVGPDVSGDAIPGLLARAGLTSRRKANLVDLLAGGGAVVRFRGRAGIGRGGLGDRAVLMRADDPMAVDRARSALGLTHDDEPVCIAIPTPNEARLPDGEKLAGCMAHGTAALRVDRMFAARYPGVVLADDRVLLHRVPPEGHTGLHQLIQALLRSTGCAAVAAFPIAEGDGPPVADAAHALEVWRRAGLAAIQLGPFWVEKDG